MVEATRRLAAKISAQTGIWKGVCVKLIHHLVLLPSSSSVTASSPLCPLPCPPLPASQQGQEGRTFLGTDGCLLCPAFCQLINAACN